jgi:acetyltransferase-like isoleucine patch superfamily enzyme/glycosyltransferase involved in cell wall biosynthesis
MNASTSNMRLLVDGYWWVDGPPSGRNVVRSILIEWAKAFPDDQLTIRVPKCHAGIVREELQRLAIAAHVDDYPSFAKYHAAAVATIRDSGSDFDAILSQNFCPPFATARRLVLVHDALYITNPEWFTRKELLYLRLLRPSLRGAATVLATSRAEASRMRGVWPELSDRIVPIGLGVPSGVTEASPKRPHDWSGTAPFILTVGRLNVRKNLARLIEAFALFAQDNLGHHLVIVGEKDGSYSPTAIPHDVSARIHFLGYVSDDELRWLYENCALFVFPSLGEGYGLPLIEANVMGALTVASDIPVFRELDMAACYFDPSSVEEIASAIEFGIGCTDKRHVSHPSWADIVRNLRGIAEREGPVTQWPTAKIRRRINDSYVRRRGIDAGIDEKITDVQVIRFVGQKVRARARGVARRLPQAFIDRNVTLLNRSGLTVGQGVSIGRGVVIDAMARKGVVLSDASTVDINAVIRGSGGIRQLGEGVFVGQRAAIGAYNFIHGGGGVEIGADVLLGPGVRIFSENHNFGRRDVPIIEQGETPAGVRVGRGAWVGAGATILAGVEIGEGAVVAAGSVVTRSVEPFSIVGGAPAKKIDDRPL